MSGVEASTHTRQTREHTPGQSAATLRLVGDGSSAGQSNQARETGAAAEQDLQPYGPQPPEFDPTVNDHPLHPNPRPQPDWWPTNWRGIPAYRQVNRDLDLSVRSQGFPYNIPSSPELGVADWTQTGGQLWRYTAQQIVPGWGEYPVGGEF
ncbi:uncharacterized protein NECHADRAFT_88390 [Fusarium vanettenii 77-13-4]|uniref:Uncharacterized protein n=1 Tax=Fusarium vanettenii (strain ATCC MYA-4622 / CBS 123669 / FGSC 9596 / NRRL 45880 / 77-13-4) TaxID=660122 RepID=C7ZMA3_FUSV7|nr:uncharacterized protein NECHADRAFT_88390 [Fusarium vanettenii 77-13-4]EEU34856.1 hypothetical protein NECHADRAFT_88390 [Fusarium vanettenii 77-13-4]